MHICHLTSAHPWNDIRILEKECVSLAKYGYKVTLLAFDSPIEQYKNVKLLNCGTKPKNRIDRMKKGARLVFEKAMELNADIYHFHDPELLPYAKKFLSKQKKVIYDAHEDLPRQLMSKPYLNRTIARYLARVVEVYENKIAKSCSGIVCATPYIEKRFSKINKNSICINNFPLENEIEKDIDLSLKQNKVCYIGSISKIRGIFEMIEALNYCQDITLDLAGNFDDETIFKQLRDTDIWQKVNYLGYINREQAQIVKKQSIAGLLCFQQVENHINSQPNKLFEYMASGLPVVCSNFPLWKEVVEKHNCGICVNSQNPLEIAQAIMYIKNNPDKAYEMGQNGIKAVRELFNWTNEEKKLIEFYESLI